MLESSLFSECLETAVIFLHTFTVSAHLVKQITMSADSMIFTEYNQQDETFHNLFISVSCSTCFRRFFRQSSGAQNCTYSVRPILLPATSLNRIAAGSSNGLTNTGRCMCSFELLMMDRKTV